MPNRLRENVNDTMSNINSGTIPSGASSVRWGIAFSNKEGVLPVKTPSGDPISYKEYRVANPNSSAPEDNVYRIVVGSDGRKYFTGTHYGQAKLGSKAVVRIK
nr:ribonuclease domain-containing protein [Rhizobium leguminosarum]